MRNAWMKLLCLVALVALAIPAAQAQTAAPAAKKKLPAPAAKKPAVQQVKAWEAQSKNNEAWWKMRNEGFIARAKQGEVSVIFLGDSITHGWEGQNELWAKDYAPLKAVNFGIGGDRTQHVIWRLLNGNLDGIQPKLVMLMIGTNNIYNDTAEDIAKGIKRIIEIIQEKSPQTKVLLLGVYPRGEKLADPGTKATREKLEALNSMIAKYDDGGKTVKYFYFGDKFLAADGSIPKELMPDFLHLSGKGYQIWADSVNPVLKDMLK